MAAFYTGFAWWWMGWWVVAFFSSLFFTPKTFNLCATIKKGVTYPLSSPGCLVPRSLLSTSGFFCS